MLRSGLQAVADGRLPTLMATKSSEISIAFLKLVV